MSDSTLREALEDLIGAINFRFAVLCVSDREKLEYADKRMWDAFDSARAALAADDAARGAMPALPAPLAYVAQYHGEWRETEAADGIPVFTAEQMQASRAAAPQSVMVVCPVCGNKRCPHAKDAGAACTASNEPGQKAAPQSVEPEQPEPGGLTEAMSPEQVARMFHECYERLAPSFGYETRADTKQFDPASPNGKLMIAVCAEVERLLGGEA